MDSINRSDLTSVRVQFTSVISEQSGVMSREPEARNGTTPPSHDAPNNSFIHTF